MSIRPSPATGKGAARTAREAMRPEFLNRIDEIVLFQKLGASELASIVWLMLGASAARLAAREVTFEVTDAAVALLAERGYEPEYVPARCVG